MRCTFRVLRIRYMLHARRLEFYQRRRRGRISLANPGKREAPAAFLTHKSPEFLTVD